MKIISPFKNSIQRANFSRTFLQHITITPKPVFGLAVACADRVQRYRDMRGPDGLEAKKTLIVQIIKNDNQSSGGEELIPHNLQHLAARPNFIFGLAWACADKIQS